MCEQLQNNNVQVFPSAANTASQDSGDFTNPGCKGVVLVIKITAGAGLSLTFTIQGKDPVSGAYYTILASSALTGTGTTVLRVYPGLTASANVTADDVLPRTWRVDVNAGNNTSATYSVGALLIV